MPQACRLVRVVRIVNDPVDGSSSVTWDLPETMLMEESVAPFGKATSTSRSAFRAIFIFLLLGFLTGSGPLPER